MKIPLPSLNQTRLQLQVQEMSREMSARLRWDQLSTKDSLLEKVKIKKLSLFGFVVTTVLIAITACGYNTKSIHDKECNYNDFNRNI